MIVAIHQPNFLPWLGYFAKIARSDCFVLLDDVQFSKGSYTNRVQIARGGAPVWLTVSVRHDFGARISAIALSDPHWAHAHCDRIKQAYGRAACFKAVWPEIESWLRSASGSLADVNSGLIEKIARRLGLHTRLCPSSSLDVLADEPDIRLAEIVRRISPNGVYLSGAGGAKYQAEAVFQAKGITLAYSDFRPEPYERSGEPFIAGLSIIDALFHLGFDATAAMLRPQR